MSLRVKDKQLLKNYNKIWKKIERLMSIDFNCKTAYGDDDYKHIKTKIKTYADIIITNFHKKIPKENVPCNCLSIIMLGSVLNVYEKYHPQTFLEECKYVQKKIKTKNYFDEKLKSDSDSDDETESNTNNE